MMHHQSTSDSEAGAVVGACFTTNYYYFSYIGSSRRSAPGNPSLRINAHLEQFVIRGLRLLRGRVLIHAE